MNTRVEGRRFGWWICPDLKVTEDLGDISNVAESVWSFDGRSVHIGLVATDLQRP